MALLLNFSSIYEITSWYRSRIFFSPFLQGTRVPKGTAGARSSTECNKTGRNDLVAVSVAVVSNSGLLGAFCGLLDQHVTKT